MRDPALIVHIVTGVVALLLGASALPRAILRGVESRALTAYHWAFLGVCASAALLALLDLSALWWFLPIAAGSYALALIGWMATRRGWSPAFRAHGLGGSYIALLTALAIVSAGGAPVVWLLPVAIGAPLISWAHRHADAGPRRPTVGRLAGPQHP